MTDTMLGIPMTEYEGIRDRLLAFKPGYDVRPGKRYMQDSMGRLWSKMLDGSGIYLINDVAQTAPQRSGPQNPLWTAPELAVPVKGKRKPRKRKITGAKLAT